MISVVSEKDAHPNITRSAALFEGGKADTLRGDNSYETDMARQQRMERLPCRQNSTQGGDR